MIEQKVTVSIIGKKKEEILDLIKIIFDNHRYVVSMKLDTQTLEYRILAEKPTLAFNPSWRSSS